MKRKLHLMFCASLFLLAFSNYASAVSVITRGLGIGSGIITGKNNTTGAQVINCFYGGGTTSAGTCSANLPSGSSLTFTVAPSTGSHFGHWNNNTGSASPCSANTTACTFTLTQDSILTASLVKPVTVSVSRDGTGSGVIEGLRAGFPATSANIKIQCGNICTFSGFSDTFILVFTGKPNTGSKFSGWHDSTGSAVVCNGKSTPCQIPIQVNTTLIGKFDKDISRP